MKKITITLTLTEEEISEVLTGLTWRYNQDALQRGESACLRAACDSAGQKFEDACVKAGIMNPGAWKSSKEYPRRIKVQSRKEVWK